MEIIKNTVTRGSMVIGKTGNAQEHEQVGIRKRSLGEVGRSTRSLREAKGAPVIRAERACAARPHQRGCRKRSKGEEGGT